MTLLLVLVFTFLWTINVQQVKASPGSIVINEDGSIQQSSALISSTDNVTYALNSDTSDSITIRRDNIILNGMGHKVQGSGMTSKGVDLWYGKKNVTITNMKIESFDYGIYVEAGGMNDEISGCNITGNNWTGIYIDHSANINVTGNIFANKIAGITFSSSPNNQIIGNTFTGDGLWVFDSYENNVDGNVINGKPLVYLEKISNRNVTSAGQVILINSTNVRVENQDLSNTTVGLWMWGTTNSRIINNTIANSYNGIWLYGNASNNVINGNLITNARNSGIYLAFSSNNNLTANTVSNSRYDGIDLESISNNNRLTGNSLMNNHQYGISIVASSNNVVYHNNFINNTQPAHIAPSPGLSNIWNSSFPSGGNYWSNYNGTDANNDALGDTVYAMDAGNTDHQPLMGMFNTFNAGTWNGTKYGVNIISKSVLSNFNFDPYAASNPTLSFTVTGQAGTSGFCRVDIPEGLMWTNTQSQWVIKVDGNPTSADRIIETSGATYIHFTYTHSTKTVQIQSAYAVPENMSSLALIALLTLTLALSAIYGRKPKRA